MFLNYISIGAAAEGQFHSYKSREAGSELWDSDEFKFRLGAKFYSNIFINLDGDEGYSLLLQPLYQITPSYDIGASASSLGGGSTEDTNYNNFGFCVVLNIGGYGGGYYRKKTDPYEDVYPN